MAVELPKKYTGTPGGPAWDAQNQYVERLMDNSAFTSAHPDDTLVLAGPARRGSLNTGTNGGNLLAIGMMQNFNASQNKPTTPVMSIGSGRQSYVSGKAQTSWGMSRLFLNGRNLLRVLYTQAVQAGIDVSKFDDPASLTDNSKVASQFYLNLDSELFLIPFGIAVLFRDKTKANIGAFYMELCAINNWAIQFASGQNFIAENVSGLADRIVPLDFEVAGAKAHAITASTLETAVLDLSETTDGALASH